jgi:hypothetical protein
MRITSRCRARAGQRAARLFQTLVLQDLDLLAGLFEPAVSFDFPD